MDDSTRTQIILAAVNMAGEPYEDESPALHEARIADAARRIMVMTGPTSRVSKAIESIEKSKVFVAEIENVTKEESSTRGLVSLKTKPSKHSPDGKEVARTERTDNAEGVAMARKLRSLIGHRVLLWVEVEEAGTRKVRVIRHVEDLGEARDSRADAA